MSILGGLLARARAGTEASFFFLSEEGVKAVDPFVLLGVAPGFTSGFHPGALLII
jgi:hypothetical protein